LSQLRRSQYNTRPILTKDRLQVYIKIRKSTALDRGSRSDRPRYCVTALPCPYALDIYFWPWSMTLTFNSKRAMVTT